MIVLSSDIRFSLSTAPRFGQTCCYYVDSVNYKAERLPLLITGLLGQTAARSASCGRCLNTVLALLPRRRRSRVRW